MARGGGQRAAGSEQRGSSKQAASDSMIPRSCSPCSTAPFALAMSRSVRAAISADPLASGDHERVSGDDGESNVGIIEDLTTRPSPRSEADQVGPAPAMSRTRRIGAVRRSGGGASDARAVHSQLAAHVDLRPAQEVPDVAALTSHGSSPCYSRR